MATPRRHRILPRADHMLRYVNDQILNNLRANETTSTISLPGIISRAYAVVNETATLEVTVLTPEFTLVEKQ